MEPTVEVAPPEAAPATPLYSVLAIRLFSIFFNPFFGGVMAYHNLRDLGRPEQARKIWWSSLTFMAGSLLVLVYVPIRGLTTGLNIAGALWLGNYYEQLVPFAKQHPRKPIWKALGISLGISLLVAAPSIYSLIARYLLN